MVAEDASPQSHDASCAIYDTNAKMTVMTVFMFRRKNRVASLVSERFRRCRCLAFFTVREQLIRGGVRWQIKERLINWASMLGGRDEPGFVW